MCCNCIKDRLSNRHSCANLYRCAVKFSQSVCLWLGPQFTAINLGNCCRHFFGSLTPWLWPRVWRPVLQPGGNSRPLTGLRSVTGHFYIPMTAPVVSPGRNPSFLNRRFTAWALGVPLIQVQSSIKTQGLGFQKNRTERGHHSLLVTMVYSRPLFAFKHFHECVWDGGISHSFSWCIDGGHWWRNPSPPTSPLLKPRQLEMR